MLSRNRVFVAGDEVGADYFIAVVAEAEAFVNGTKARAGGFAIQADVTASKGAGTVNGPLHERGGDARAGEVSAHGETMDIGGFAGREVGPEERVFELEFDGADGLAGTFGEEEKVGGDVQGDAGGG